MRLLFLAPLALILAACQSSGGLGSGGNSQESSGASASTSTSAPTSVPAPASDDCAAADFQRLVGTSGDAVNRGELPGGTRVLRPTTPMTPDYRPDRLNIYIDDSGQVEKVVCG